MCDKTTCVELINLVAALIQETLTLHHQVKDGVSGVNKVADFLACGFWGGFLFCLGNLSVYFLVARKECSSVSN